MIAAFFANLGIAIAKFIGFLFTGSSSMRAGAYPSCLWYSSRIGARTAFDAGLTTTEPAVAINEVERRVRQVAPIVRPMYIEPDLYSTAPSEDTT